MLGNLFLHSVRGAECCLVSSRDTAMDRQFYIDVVSFHVMEQPAGMLLCSNHPGLVLDNKESILSTLSSDVAMLRWWWGRSTARGRWMAMLPVS